MALKIAIAGAGLLGRLAAWRLARAGHEVTVFDPADGPESLDAPGKAAGWTAAGMLSPVAELESADDTVFRLGLRSLELWQAYQAQLTDAIDVRANGSLLLAYSADAGAAARVVDQLSARAPQAYWPQAIGASQLRELEPDVHGPTLAWQLPAEGQLDSVKAMRALAAAGAACGVQWRWRRSIACDSLSWSDAGGEPGKGREKFAFERLFDLRGVGARPPLPVRGVRGEIFWLHAPGVRLNRPLRLLHPRHRVYLVPRSDDLIVVGASEIESEDRSPVSVRTCVELLAAAHSVMPGLAEARVVRSDVNLRPALPDNLPLIRHDGEITRINGLFRHGWLIAPALLERALEQIGLGDGVVPAGSPGAVMAPRVASGA